MNADAETKRLSDDQLAQYERDGYIVVEDLVPQAVVQALLARVHEYTHEGRDPGKIAIQVEPRVRRGELKIDHPGDGIRKLEGLIEHDDLFQQLGLHANIIGIIEQILGPDLKMFRNALLVKPPQVGSAKGMHQDSPYWSIAPMDLCSCWFALNDATTENGCMAVIPGGHKLGHLPHVHVQDDFIIEEQHYDAASMVLAPMKSGSGLFFHSLIPHYTAPNVSKTWRRAIALSYMRSSSTFTGEGEGPVYFHVKGQTFPNCVR